MTGLRCDDRSLVLFRLEDRLCALRLSGVERVFRAVEITPLPKAPEIVLGVINVQGRIIPVLDVRRRFRLPAREMDVDDQIIIARTPKRLMALAVDEVIGVHESEPGEIAGADKHLPFAEHLRGVAKQADGLILIYDLDHFLALDEERGLDAAISGRTK